MPCSRENHAFWRFPTHECVFEVLSKTRAFLRTHCLNVAEHGITSEMPASNLTLNGWKQCVYKANRMAISSQALQSAACSCDLARNDTPKRFYLRA
jgi:hypothetical protein